MHVFLDLDGTLTDPGVGIARCIVHAFERLGLAPPTAQALRRCVGPPLAESFHTLLGTEDESLVREAIAHYRERFAAVGMFENEVYPGVPEVLGELETRGFQLRVVTSKPTVFAGRILHHFDLAKYVLGVHGSELDGTRSAKTALIAHVLETQDIPARTATMVGDRSQDILGARRNGVAAIGALWGYGSADELSRAGAAAIVRDPVELLGTLGRPTRQPTPAG